MNEWMNKWNEWNTYMWQQSFTWLCYLNLQLSRMFLLCKEVIVCCGVIANNQKADEEQYLFIKAFGMKWENVKWN